MFSRLIFISIFIVFSCKKKERFDAVSIIGHAGNGLNISSSIYHDNSNEAIELALATSDCDGVEVDIQLSKDGVLWLYHDPDLSTETNSTSCINSKTSNELQNVTYKTVLHEKLIQLNSLDANYLKGKTIFLDTRHNNECESKEVNLGQMIASMKQFHQLFQETTIYVMTNNENWVDSLANEAFEIIFSAETTSIAATIDLSKVEGFMFKNDAITKDQVSYYQTLGKKVIIFEVRSPEGIRSALRKYPSHIVTDDIRSTIIEKYP